MKSYFLSNFSRSAEPRNISEANKKPLYLCSKSSSADSNSNTIIGQDPQAGERKRSELVHKEEKSFWRSWFGFGSSFEYDSDSDDEKRKRNDLKFKTNNSNRSDHGRLDGPRKSSAERATNFNAPTEEEKAAAKLQKKSRSSSVREVR